MINKMVPRAGFETKTRGDISLNFSLFFEQIRPLDATNLPFGVNKLIYSNTFL